MTEEQALVEAQEILGSEAFVTETLDGRCCVGIGVKGAFGATWEEALQLARDGVLVGPTSN